MNKPAADLLFLAKRYPDWDMASIAQQVDGKQKAKYKIPTWFKKEGILYPIGLSMEQCSSEFTAKYKKKLCKGEKFIDLTGGFGVDSYFISKSFKQSIYCELNSDLHKITEHNFSILKSNIKSLNNDGLKYLKKTNEKFDLIYIDPSRRSQENKKVIELKQYTPNILNYLELLFKKGKNILLKTSPYLDIKRVLNQLYNVESVHVLTVNKECKEVLYLLNEKRKRDPIIHCIDITKKLKFNFTFEEEENICNITQPLTYLYEPNAAILKAGGFNSIGNSFQIKKLHTNSHLYTSNELIDNFPGRRFIIEKITKLNNKDITQILPDKKANITRRNFPISVAEIRKKIKIKEGGSKYLFATTLKDNKPRILFCSKV